MVEENGGCEAPEAALGRDGPHDPKLDLALAYHWTTYARRRNGIIPEGLKCQNQPGGVDLDAVARWRRYSHKKQRDYFEARNFGNRVYRIPPERWASFDKHAHRRAVERIQAVRDFTARMLAAR